MCVHAHALTQVTHSPVISTEGMVSVDHAYNSSTKKAKVGGLLQVECHPGQHREFTGSQTHRLQFYHRLFSLPRSGDSCDLSKPRLSYLQYVLRIARKKSPLVNLLLLFLSFSAEQPREAPLRQFYCASKMERPRRLSPTPNLQPQGTERQSLPRALAPVTGLAALEAALGVWQQKTWR